MKNNNGKMKKQKTPTVEVLHKSLYKMIPEFHCNKDCTACCGPVPLTPWEAERLGIPGEVVTPTKPGTLTCSFVKDDKCSVYEKRPLMCRIFGGIQNQKLTCPFGCGPIVKLPKKAEEYIFQRYGILMNQGRKK